MKRIYDSNIKLKRTKPRHTYYVKGYIVCFQPEYYGGLRMKSRVFVTNIKTGVTQSLGTHRRSSVPAAKWFAHWFK
jgi:hypothetical protein